MACCIYLQYFNYYLNIFAYICQRLLICMIMNFTGIIVGLATFIIIGIFHPIVVKAEYYWGVKCWWLFLVAGIIFGALSLFVQDLIISTILGVTAFSSFWSILEIVHQKERVKKGWFPEGPGHKR